MDLDFEPQLSAGDSVETRRRLERMPSRQKSTWKSNSAEINNVTPSNEP